MTRVGGRTGGCSTQGNVLTGDARAAGAPEAGELKGNLLLGLGHDLEVRVVRLEDARLQHAWRAISVSNSATTS